MKRNSLPVVTIFHSRLLKRVRPIASSLGFWAILHTSGCGNGEEDRVPKQAANESPDCVDSDEKCSCRGNGCDDEVEKTEEVEPSTPIPKDGDSSEAEVVDSKVDDEGLGDDDSEDDELAPSDKEVEIKVDGDAELPKYSLVVDGPSRRTSSTALVSLTGRVSSLYEAAKPQAIQWTGASAGGSINVNENGTFSLGMLLDEGENTLVFSVPGSDTSSTVVVSVNEGYHFGSSLDLPVDVAYAGEARAASAHILLTDAATIGQSVRLVQVQGDSETVVATLTDDGDLENADEIEGDGFYSGSFVIDEPKTGELSYRVVVAREGTNVEARSEQADVLVTEHLSSSEMEAMILSTRGWSFELEQADDASAALDKVLESLQTDKNVLQYGHSEGADGAWFVFENGILGAAVHQTLGTKGASTGDKTTKLGLSGGERTVQAAETAGAPFIGSSKALLLAAQYFDWGDADDIPQIAASFSDSCYGVTYKTYGSWGEGDLEDFKGFGKYGMVAVSTHGGVFYEGVQLNLMLRYGWKHKSGQVVMDSNMEITAENIMNYEDDLHRGRIALWGKTFGILPGFFERYSGDMAGTIVYASICYGGYNASLADVFLAKGASAFLGYTDIVGVGFCQEHGTEFFDELLKGSAVEAAFTPGLVETDSHPAEFVLFGQGESKLPIGLGDAGFEQGRIDQGWQVEGDARAIKKLGEAVPTEGDWMGLVSTGLGFQYDSGTVGQTLCLCKEATAITWDYNFFSEEWLEYVENGFQDSFSVWLSRGESEEQLLLYENIDSLAADVSPVENSFDKGDVYATGWRTQSVSIDPDWAGQKARLQFYAEDVGDSIYDSAVLIDNIKIEGCTN